MLRIYLGTCRPLGAGTDCQAVRSFTWMMDDYTHSFALAAWNGLFYIFHWHDPFMTVYRLTPQGLLPDARLHIIGAGVAACY